MTLEYQGREARIVVKPYAGLWNKFVYHIEIELPPPPDDGFLPFTYERDNWEPGWYKLDWFDIVRFDISSAHFHSKGYARTKDQAVIKAKKWIKYSEKKIRDQDNRINERTRKTEYVYDGVDPKEVAKAERELKKLLRDL